MANEGSTKATYEELERALDIMTEKYKAEYGYVESAREERDQIAKTCDLLRAENLRVRGLLQRQWISVEERVPELIVGTYLVLDAKWANVQAIWDGKWHHDNLRNTGIELKLVTHWIPLPAPPNSETTVSPPDSVSSEQVDRVITADKSVEYSSQNATFPQSSSLVAVGALFGNKTCDAKAGAKPATPGKPDSEKPEKKLP